MESLSDITFQGGSAFDEGGMLVKRVDFVSDTVLYVGQALPGTATTVAAWRIKRVTLGPGDDVTEEWAGGSNAFSRVWDDRASLSYS